MKKTAIRHKSIPVKKKLSPSERRSWFRIYSHVAYFLSVLNLFLFPARANVQGAPLAPVVDPRGADPVVVAALRDANLQDRDFFAEFSMAEAHSNTRDGMSNMRSIAFHHSVCFHGHTSVLVAACRAVFIRLF
jgi:hypothetical protein